MIYIKPFSELSKLDAGVAGGKGASLGEMTRAGIPVPGGFVVLAEAFEKFLEETDLGVEIDSILHSVDTEKMHTVEHASEAIQQLILGAKMPEDIAGEIFSDFKKLDAPFVAVRSSATAEDSASAAWAGQLDSFLNTTKETLLKNVQRCWASLFTPRAVFYRFEKGLHTQKISVAVVVQKMVASEASGIAFSVHPVTEDYNQLIIEAGFGLGEAIVSGQITPDSYVVEKNPRRIVDKNIAEQERGIFRREKGEMSGMGVNEWRMIPYNSRNEQKLSDEQIFELSEIILAIENHYGFPCDIEWAFEGGKFYIVQSRPITTLAPKSEDAPIVMVNLQSREHSLVYCHVWQIANQVQTKGWFKDVKNILFIHSGANKKTRVWYGKKELEDVFLESGRRTENEKDFFDRLSNNFLFLTQELLPYWEGEKKISSLEEWKWFYEKWIEWWAPMAIIFVLPESKTAPSFIREKSLALRAQVEQYSDVGDRLAMDFLRDQYPKYEELIEYMTPEEVFHIEDLSEKQIDEIKKRREGYVFLNGKLHALDEFETLIATHGLLLEEPRVESDSEIEGAIASRGKITGTVIVVYGKKDLSRVTHGSVLVTEMTSPDYVPAMKLAVAIVTDEGGVNCHAAIVSRELKKPCIIGTKIATQVLKDGDLVEVDADNGVVRVLERNKVGGSAPKLHDYQKLFQWKGDFSYFLNSFFMSIYSDLHALTAFDGEMWRSYLPLKSKEKTLFDGVSIYGSPEKYSDLRRGILDGYQSLQVVFEDALKKEKITQEDLKKCFNTSIQYYSFYQKTEFFYTDKAFEESSKNEEIRKNLISFEALKLRGREQLNELALMPDNYLERLLQRIGLQFRYDIEDLRNLSMEEIVMLFKGAFPVSKADILNRRKSYVTKGDGVAFSVLEGEVAKEFSKEFLKDLKHEQKLSGQSAQRGVRRGKARVFRISLSEIGETGRLIDQMIDGEILVADTTAPEIIAACKKASAIVTNQGGLLSHAAITSRELGIPCIVGTGYATEIIQTGDMIEVDADSGVVRVLERSEEKNKG